MQRPDLSKHPAMNHKKAVNYHVISKLLLKMKRFEEKYFMMLRQGGGPGKAGAGGVGGGGISGMLDANAPKDNEQVKKVQHANIINVDSIEINQMDKGP